MGVPPAAHHPVVGTYQHQEAVERNPEDQAPDEDLPRETTARGNPPETGL